MNPAPTVFIVSPTESELTTRGKRHPDLARVLAARGLRVRYVSSTFDHARHARFDTAARARAAEGLTFGLHWIEAGLYRHNISVARVGWNRRFTRRAIRWLTRQVKPGDAIVLPSRPPELIAAVAALANQRGCRTLLDIRDIWPDALMDRGQSLAGRCFARYCEYYLRRGLPRINAFTHVAPSFLPWLHRFVPAAQSTWLPLGYSAARWGQPPARQNRRTPMRLIHAGTLTHQFDVLPILAAIKGAADRFTLDLVGDDGRGERAAAVRATIARDGSEAQVRIRGLLPPAQLAAELPDYDLALVPMISGALPNKFFDALGAGVPMLSLGDGDSSRLVHEHGLGWTAPFEPAAIRATLDRIDDTGLNACQARIAAVRPRFAREKILETFADRIGDLLNR